MTFEAGIYPGLAHFSEVCGEQMLSKTGHSLYGEKADYRMSCLWSGLKQHPYPSNGIDERQNSSVNGELPLPVCLCA